MIRSSMRPAVLPCRRWSEEEDLEEDLPPSPSCIVKEWKSHTAYTA